MANLSNTVLSGKAKGGCRSAFYRDAKGTMRRCEVISGPIGGPFTIYVPSLKPAGVAVARKDRHRARHHTQPNQLRVRIGDATMRRLNGRVVDGPPELTETERLAAYGKLLTEAVYGTDPVKIWT